MHKNKTKHFEIDIEVSKKFGNQGSCVNEDDEKPSRYFTIQLRDAKDDNDIFHTLAHEMVHLKQYAHGQLTKDLMFRGSTGDVYLKTLWYWF